MVLWKSLESMPSQHCLPSFVLCLAASGVCNLAVVTNVTVWPSDLPIAGQFMDMSGITLIPPEAADVTRYSGHITPPYLAISCYILPYLIVESSYGRRTAPHALSTLPAP